MSEMVERVKLAIMRNLGNPEAMSRAAILAMREPPEAMGWPESLSQYWRAGIDEALK